MLNLVLTKASSKGDALGLQEMKIGIRVQRKRAILDAPIGEIWDVGLWNIVVLFSRKSLNARGEFDIGDLTSRTVSFHQS